MLCLARFRDPAIFQPAAPRVISIPASFVTLRLLWHASPHSDPDVDAGNIHPLFAGPVFVTAGRAPLAIVNVGTALGMVPDGWVYRNVTPGANAIYLLPVSTRGAVAIIVLTCRYAGLPVVFAWRKRRQS